MQRATTAESLGLGLVKVAAGVLVLAIAGCCRPVEPRKVAVLIATEQADSPTLPANAEFWNDTVLMYCMLRANGFGDSDIYVLYGDGHDAFLVASEAPVQGVEPSSYYQSPYCDTWPGTVPDFPMSVVEDDANAAGVVGCGGDGRCRRIGCREDPRGTWHCAPKAIFDCLARGCADPREAFHCPTCSSEPIRPLGKDDYLFVWWKGHGLTTEHGEPKTFKLDIGEDVEPEVVSGWMAAIATPHRTFVFETCRSGCLEGLRPDLLGAVAGPAPAVLASSTCTEITYSRGPNDRGGHLHGPWSYWVAITLWGELPPFGTSQPDGSPPPICPTPGTSLRGAFDESYKGTIRQLGGIQTPVLKDCSGVAPGTRINAPAPGGDATPTGTPEQRP